MEVRRPLEVLPGPIAGAVADLPWWFVIGGQAVRCFCPYRPSRDVDFGVASEEKLEALLARLRERGAVEVLERSEDTVHLRFEGLDVSIFVLDRLVPFVTERRLDVTGLLATKLHAILDRGTRRDFFDLYLTLHLHSLGIAECLSALREVFGPDVNEPLLLRALTYFGDADREAPLPGEGPDDWKTVRDFFLARVGHVLTPPSRALAIQSRVVDVAG